MESCCRKNIKPIQETLRWKQYWRPTVSLTMLIIGGVFRLVNPLSSAAFGWIDLLWYVLAYLPVGWPVMLEAFYELKKGLVFSEYTLMTVATLGAFYISSYPEGVAVMLFYAIGEALQDRAVSGVKRNIAQLLDVRPETVTVIQNGESVVLSPQQVSIGNVIEVKPGSRVSLDGKLVSDIALFDTSALTGESVPRVVKSGEKVLAGMLVSDKVVRIEVTELYNKSMLARILELVQNASERKAPAELFIRKFARIYTPIVIALGVLIVLIPYIIACTNPSFNFVFNDWLYKALTFLVVSCPCALVISIPLGYFGGIGAASKQGILFKGANFLDIMAKVNTVVFDKTGTLTRGIFDVQSIQTAEGINEQQLIGWIASLEQQSVHPIAKAVLRYAAHRNIVTELVQDMTDKAGFGLEGVVSGQKILVGNIRLLEKYRVKYPNDLQKVAETLVTCAVDGRYVGCLLLSDILKDDATKAVSDLQLLNIRNIQMLSGDKQSIVTNFANILNIRTAIGDLLPEGKVKYLEQLKRDKNNCIVFVGDGMNDAPVLAMSDIGVAMGGLGSDAAVETADVVIQNDQPSKVAVAIRIGKHTRRIIWENISMSITVKILVMILGALGLATLWEAVFADVGVALLAIANAVRIYKMN